MRKSSPHLFQLTAIGRGFQKGYTQSGIWEKGILCGDCDGRLGVLDNYAYSILPSSPDLLSFVQHDPWIRTYNLGNIDVDRFKKFLIAVSWRAHHAKHLLFRGVNLGPYEARFRNALLNQAPQGVPDAVSVVVVLMEVGKLKDLMLPPFRNRFEGVNVLQFYLNPWKLLIKMSERDFQDPFLQLAIRPGKENHALVSDTWSQGEQNLIADMRRRLNG
jgi:hypothetical protein